MSDQFSRTELLIGKEGTKKLQDAKIAIFGIGGVGSFTVEALARAGIGHIVLSDYDIIDITNINRQILALHSNIGKYKVEVMKERILDINPNATVEIYKPNQMQSEENLINSSFSYIIDAIDTIPNKIKLIEKANKEGVEIISAAGTANKLDPTKFEVSDIYKTSVCPVCKVLRKELKKREIKNLKVVYSKEEPIKPKQAENSKENKLGSISFVPSVAGLIIAGEVIKDLIRK